METSEKHKKTFKWCARDKIVFYVTAVAFSITVATAVILIKNNKTPKHHSELLVFHLNDTLLNSADIRMYFAGTFPRNFNINSDP